jgi:hypothetical protein
MYLLYKEKINAKRVAFGHQTLQITVYCKIKEAKVKYEFFLDELRIREQAL